MGLCLYMWSSLSYEQETIVYVVFKPSTEMSDIGPETDHIAWIPNFDQLYMIQKPNLFRSPLYVKTASAIKLIKHNIPCLNQKKFN